MSSPSVASILGEKYASECERIRQQFQQTWDGVAAVQARSALVDQLALDLYRSFIHSDSSGPQGFCMAAVGGFGRRVLFPHSDVDILFLWQHARTERLYKDAIAGLCRSMWDLGLRISPAARTLAECNQLHRSNLEFNISLLDCRYLAGDRELFSHLRERAVPQLVAREFQPLTQNLAALARERHAKFGNTIFHLEPNLKDCPGGLRDYNLACWLVLIAELERRRAWPASERLLPRHADDRAQSAFAFVSALRCFLHYQLGRDNNVLSYELQAQAAAAGVSAEVAMDAAAWMRCYFRHTREIYSLAVQLLDEVPPAHSSLYRSYQQWRSRLSNADFMVSQGRVFVRQHAALATPAGMLALFEFVARHGLSLSQESERRVVEALASIRNSISGLAELWPSFRHILLLPGAADTLRAMHRLGVLALLFPEFQRIDALVLRDYYHRYTVDEHSFLCIENLHRLRREEAGLGKGFCEILQAVEHPELLFLSLLFHDVGKGMEGESHISGSLQALDTVLARLRMEEAAGDSVRFLVANHLEMSLAISRRDIFDPETVRAFADKTGTPERLKMLCLMTYADIKAVNPEALTPWRAEILWQLYVATSNYLTRRVDQDRLTTTPTATSPAMPTGDAAILAGLPKRYLSCHSRAEIARHCEMVRELDRAPVQLQLDKNHHSYSLTVVTADRPFLFATIAGALAAWAMNIVKADAFCNSAGVVIDTFRFTDIFRTFDLNPSEVERFKNTLRDAIAGALDVRTLLDGRARGAAVRPAKITVPAQITFDDLCSSHSTLLELIAQDRPGLLSQVASTLSALGCNIELALVDTEGHKAIDVFYLTIDGKKLSSAQTSDLQEALLEELQATR